MSWTVNKNNNSYIKSNFCIYCACITANCEVINEIQILHQRFHPAVIKNNGIYHVEYCLEDAAQDESTIEASSAWQHLQDHLALPALAGLAHAVCKNWKITNMGYI